VVKYLGIWNTPKEFIWVKGKVYIAILMSLDAIYLIKAFYNIVSKRPPFGDLSLFLLQGHNPNPILISVSFINTFFPILTAVI